jgi:hypothetical protein
MSVHLCISSQLNTADNYEKKYSQFNFTGFVVHNEVLHHLYFSQNFIRMIKSRTKRCEWHVGGVGEMKNTKFWLERLKGSGHSEDLDVDENIYYEKLFHYTP